MQLHIYSFWELIRCVEARDQRIRESCSINEQRFLFAYAIYAT